MITLTVRSNRIRHWHRSYAFLLATLFVLSFPTISLAHPLGNFTVNRYSRLDLDSEQIMLTYVVDMAEVPTQQERSIIDIDGNGKFSQAEQDAYLAETLPGLQKNLILVVNDQAQPWTAISRELTVQDGQAGLPTLRMRIQFSTPLDASEAPLRATFRDGNYPERLGWQEVVVQNQDDIDLLESSVPVTDLSRELTEYPTDLLQSPPTVNQAEFQYQRVAVGASMQSDSISPSVTIPSSRVADNGSADTGSLNAQLAASSDPFAELIHLPNLEPWTLFVALLAAFGWGAAHALSPGHGKTIVGAYLVGSRGTAKHALFLGLTTTITHTAGVFALGLITLFASRYILPETLFPWLSLLSGLLVVVIGLSMAWNWIGRFRQHQSVHDPSHHHGHDHNHDHAHDHGHAHHDYNHADHNHYEHNNEYHHGGLHTHDGVHYHSHDVPGQDGSPVTWRSLLALGISGGLLPCPSALVVMLGAIALQRVAFGLVLIVAFSLGLAGVLTAIGLALVYASHFFAKLPESGRVLKLLPVASALFITMLGIGIAWQAVIRIM